MTRRADPERDFLIVSLVSAGETLQAIGDRFGITRERVRQVAKRHGLIRREMGIARGADPIAICRAAETASSLTEVAKTAGCTPLQARRVLTALGKWRDVAPRLGVQRQFTDEELLDSLRRLATELGHTPGLLELRPRSPTAQTYANHFGTVTEALRRAGLPLKHARRNKLTPAQRTEIAQRHVRGREGNTSTLAAEFGVSLNTIYHTVRDRVSA